VRFGESLRALNRRRTTGVYFVGYPKTGNTWTRFLVGRYVQRVCGLKEPPLFDGYDRWGRCQRACVGPGMYFTHSPLRWDVQTAADLDRAGVVSPFDGRPVVLIVRYPLDVLVSAWMQERHRRVPPYEGDLSAFVADPVFGIEKLLAFHRIWGAERDRPDGLHLLRYEDLRADAVAGLRDVLSFVGIPVESEAVTAAAAESSFERMRELEESGAAPRYQTSGQSVFATGDRMNPEAFHLRSGVVGGYARHLADSEADALERRISSEMPSWYGYASPPVEGTHVA